MIADPQPFRAASAWDRIGAVTIGTNHEAPGVPPHPTLTDYYADEGSHQSYLTRIFDETAPLYDRIIGSMSFGSGAWYRRHALRRAGLVRGMKVLDVAVGTGAVARAAVGIAGPSGIVVGLDPSRGMLAQASKALRIPLIMGIAQELPCRAAAFDFVSMGYALRHVSELRQTLREFFRVLRPGGTMLLLDFAPPRSRVGLSLGRFYLNRVVPWMARLGPGSQQAQLLVRYCWDTVENLVVAETILDAVTDCGFREARQATRFGVLSEYLARRP